MTVTLEKHIRDLAVLASVESEDEVSEALLLIVRGSRLPRAVRCGLLEAVAGLLDAAEMLSERHYPGAAKGGSPEPRLQM